ncbi:metallophosphoesterase family protein [Flavitalea flava]
MNGIPQTYVIGDIHGALKALEQVLGKIGLQKEDRLIFLGDYVDGWSESAQVIDYLMRLEPVYDCHFIKGNHDLWCEEWLRGEGPDGTWLLHGGAATINSYNTYSSEQRATHLEFFERMPEYRIEEEGRLFVHAGFTSMHGPARERFENNLLWDRTLWEMALSVNPRLKKTSKKYPKRLLLYNEIYIGHTPTTNYDIDIPMLACNVWNVDTGAAFTGKITVLNVASKAYWQSVNVRDLYPGEAGRNK